MADDLAEYLVLWLGGWFDQMIELVHLMNNT